MDNFTFSTLEYKRPDFEALMAKLDEYSKKLENASSYEEAKEIYNGADKITCEYTDAYTICMIRHTINTKDKFYSDENDVFDEMNPLMGAKSIGFSKVLKNCKFRDDFEKEYGHQLFVGLDIAEKSFSEKNIPLRQKEAKLTTEYENIIASCDVDFMGKKCNLYGLQKFFEHENREVRRNAFKAYSDFFHSHEKRFEEIWDELITIRNEMGRNLGFENFIPLGYLEMSRVDYDEKDVASFREQVKEVLVPFCEKIYKSQAKRLGVDEIYAYDEKRVFPDGNAQPAGDDDYMIEKAREMYHKISPETAEFIDFMIDHEMLDLKNRPGKAATGYMTSIYSKNSPFVFSCFNQTIGDMQVLSHELGHAFAGYRAMRTQPITEYYNVPTDIAEIHSMTMEQFAYPYIEMFFGDDADKYRFQHLQEAITFVPFGVAVDEFQHICYANPELTPRERTLEWKKLEEKYMPWRKYDSDDFFDRGGYWYHKIHIMLYPMYYINYTLTTMGAMEMKTKDSKDHESAWKDYLRLCDCGGSMGYLETLKYANLSNPFEKGTVKKSCEYALNILEKSL